MSGLKPTLEQAAAIAAFRRGESVTLTAGAGTGKTSTLRMLAESTPDRKGLYAAYNKAIQSDAEGSFPNSTTVRTTHSLAMRAVGRPYQSRLSDPRVPGKVAAKRLGILQPFDLGPGLTPVRPAMVARLAIETVGRFCLSSDSELLAKHVPDLNRIDEDGPLRNHFVRRVLPLAEKVWHDLSDPDGDKFRFTHDVYLKIWALGQPVLGFDYILFDEAQDTTDVVAGVIARQVDAGTQLVVVGDEAQSIYQWRGAKSAMSKFLTDHRLSLTAAFRFGPRIADEANKWLAELGLDLRLTGNDSIASRVVEPIESAHAYLSRTNAATVGDVIQAHSEGIPVAIVGGGREITMLARAAGDLRAGRSTDHPELALFKTWAEVQEFVDDGDAPDLKPFVQLVDSHGPEAIDEAVRRCVDEQGAQRIVTTAHKAKGREWPSVRIGCDFAEPDAERNRFPNKEELMLSYVAITRAREILDRGNLSWIDNVSGRAVPVTTTSPQSARLERAELGCHDNANRNDPASLSVDGGEKAGARGPASDAVVSPDHLEDATTETLLELLVDSEQRMESLTDERRALVAQLDAQIRTLASGIDEQIAEARHGRDRMKHELLTRLKPGTQASVRGGTIRVRPPNRRFDLEGAFESLPHESQVMAMKPDSTKVKKMLSKAEVEAFMMPGTGEPSIVVRLDNRAE